MQSVENDIKEFEAHQVKIKLLDELIAQKTNHLNKIKEALKTFEAYSIGVREIIEKNEPKIKHSQKEALDLFGQQKINLEVYAFIRDALDDLYNSGKNNLQEIERIFLTRQLEVAMLTQDVENITNIKSLSVNKVHELETVVELNKKSQERNHRPDQDPNTIAGRAAMDVASRKNKAKKSS